ncbi:MAG: tetratricopeptide repeat protein [Proteobacteria bacterium]|nr:tetratricopeptide repeat protein [Pseudomonadota bacterium]
MVELLSEKEQIEAMRDWWRENGRFVIGGIVLGVGILVGWHQWKEYRLTARLEASARYETLANQVSGGMVDAAEANAKELYENYASTSYAALARLAMARLYMDRGRDQDAADTLEALLAIRGGTETQMVGRLRLAKIYLYQEQPQEVVDLLSGFEDTAFAARYDELLGDAHAALGQIPDAAAAYARAMADDPRAPTVNRSLIQMKIVDLPDDEPALEEAASEEPAADESVEPAADTSVEPAADEVVEPAVESGDSQ